MLEGPKRSGKGTIARILSELLGSSNVCGPTLAGLGSNFGLMPLIGKQLAIISDARLGGRADLHTITERLLAISGEDALTIDRKFKEPWYGQLSTRFMILTNELPQLVDASGALVSRFILLRLAEACESETKSYCGQVTPGRGRLLSCLYAHEDKLSAQCINTLYDGLSLLERAVDEISYWVTQCDQDIDDYCAATEMGAWRIARCLLDNKAELSERCTSAIDEVGMTVE